MIWTEYNAIYFFIGQDYDKWLIADNISGSNFPKNIAQEWPGIFSDNIDACFVWYSRNVAVFFQGDQYLEYDMTLNKMISGFPKKIAGNWNGLPWNADIDAAFALKSKNVAFLFKGNKYIKYDLSTNKILGVSQSLSDFSLE